MFTTGRQLRATTNQGPQKTGDVSRLFQHNFDSIVKISVLIAVVSTRRLELAEFHTFQRYSSNKCKITTNMNVMKSTKFA